MASRQDLINALRQADAQGDTAGAQRIAAMLKSAPQAQAPHGQIAGTPDFGDIGNAAYSAGLHFVHQIPVVGDAVLTGARELADARNGEGFVPVGQANAEVHQILDSAKTQHPIASTAGGAVGGVGSLAVGGEALDGAAGGRLALKAGQPIANTARLAATGAATGGAMGAADAAVRGGNAHDVASSGVSGAVMGAAAGPLAAGAGRVAVAAGRRFATPLSAKTALALSKVFGENSADLQAAWAAHMDATGRPPSMAELANYKQQGAIRGMAKDSTPIASALQANAEQAAADRSANMQTGFSTGMHRNFTPTGAASPEDLANVRTAQGDVDYPAAREHYFKIPTTPDDALGGATPSDHIAGEILPQAGLGRADRVRIHNGLQAGTLSGQDAQLLRSGLSESLSRNYSPAVKGYLSDLEGILGGPGNEDANAALQQATGNYATGSRRVEGAQHGAGILGAETPANYAATATAKPNATPEFAQGMQLGANDKLATASATPQGATSLAQRLASDDALHQKLVDTFGQGPADALRRMGAAETSAARAVAPYNRAPAPEDDKAALKDVGQAAMAVASHGLGWKAYHAAKVFAGLAMPANVQEKVAQYLSDPKMAQQGINLLAKAGASAQYLRQIALTAAAASGILSGGAASSSVSESQP